MKADIINPFLKSTIHMFREMFGIDPGVQKPYILNNFGNHRWEISGIIGLTGSHAGIVVLRLPRQLALKLLEKSGLELDDEDTDQMINEMVGEFINIISGNAINTLVNYDVDISPPVIVQGRNHRIAWPDHGPIVVVPFTTVHGPFVVNVSVKQLRR